MVVALSVAHTKTNATGWESIPQELQAHALSKLLEDGNYTAFLSAYNTSQSMRHAIDSNPVLIGTLRGIKQLKDTDMGAIIYGKMHDVYYQTDFLIEDAEKISKEALYQPDQIQIFSNLMNWIITKTHQAINPNKKLDTSNIQLVLRTIASEITEKNLQGLDSLTAHLFQTANYSKRTKYEVSTNELMFLAQNNNIPTDLILERIKVVPQDAIQQGSSITDNINSALFHLTIRPDIGEKTIQYFKEHENDPNWQENRGLSGALRAIKQILPIPCNRYLVLKTKPLPIPKNKTRAHRQQTHGNWKGS